MCRSNCSYLSVDRNCRSRHRMSNIDCGRRPSGDPTYGYVGIGGSFLYHSKISMPSGGHGSGAGISDETQSVYQSTDWMLPTLVLHDPLFVYCGGSPYPFLPHLSSGSKPFYPSKPTPSKSSPTPPHII